MTDRDTDDGRRCACGTALPAGARFCPGCGVPLQPQAEVRKLVTVAFCDLVGSTALAERLGAEALRDVLRRHLDAMRAAAEDHGGTVERLIGDAVLAVFGVPVAHEDDALRALRAALAMREAVGRLNAELATEWDLKLAVRVGVNSGEVVAGDPRAARAVALGDVLGDAVNVAARLQDAAAPGEILMGDLTRRLVGVAVDATPRQVAVRGRSEGVRAWSLRAIRDAPGPPAAPSPFLGRAAELLALEHAVGCAVRDRRCRLVAVVGDPGVGKSRLARELEPRLPDGARLVRGRCLPYGEGITFWPFAEVLREVAGVRAADGPGEVFAKLRALVDGAPDGAFLLSALAGLLGAGERPLGDDLGLALRRLLEHLGRQAPLVVELDDLQWADTALLDLVEALPSTIADAAVLVVAVGRPELLELRPSLAGPDALHLEPLPRHLAEELVSALLPAAPPDVRRRVAAAAQGNPLFAEQLAAAGTEDESLPPTLGVLLQARIERLPPAERALLERAAVVGEDFDVAAVAALGVADAGPVLDRLASRGLVVPREGGGRFRHLLVRDAAYERLPRSVRSELHERHAEWLDAAAGERRAAVDAIVAHHLERAARCRMELGRRDPALDELRTRASGRLAEAGRRALASGDAPAAIGLLERALRLCDGPAALLEAELGGALCEDARFDAARTHLARALAHGDERARRRATVAAGFVRIDADPEPRCEELVEEGRSAAAVLAALGDLAGAARAWALVAVAHHHRGRQAQRLEALERSIALAREAGESVARQLDQLASALLSGPTPLAEARRRVAALLEDAGGSPTIEASLLEFLGGMATLAGDREEGRRLLGESRARYRALGGALASFHIAATTGSARLFSGEPAAGLHHLRSADAILAPLGERSRRSSIQALMACAHAFLGELAPALAAASLADELGAPDDVFTQLAARAACAWAHAEAGRSGEAVAHGRAALAAAGGTDAPLWSGLAELALAKGLLAAGDAAAERHVRRAEERFLAKGVPWLGALAGSLGTPSGG